jgi:hypothetical protein
MDDCIVTAMQGALRGAILTVEGTNHGFADSLGNNSRVDFMDTGRSVRRRQLSNS